MTKEYGIRPAPGTCCPEMKYKFLFIDKLSNGALWEIFRCSGCGTLKRRFLCYTHEIEVVKEEISSQADNIRKPQSAYECDNCGSPKEYNKVCPHCFSKHRGTKAD